VCAAERGRGSGASLAFVPLDELPSATFAKQPDRISFFTA